MELLGGNNFVGALYRADVRRFGYYQEDRGVKDGDLVLCVMQRGDNYYDYILVLEQEGRLRGSPKNRVQSYGLNHATATTLSDRNYHLLAAGETISIPEDLK